MTARKAKVLDLDQVARELGMTNDEITDALAEAIDAGFLKIARDDGTTVRLVACFLGDDQTETR